jgi:hypothetical protein
MILKIPQEQTLTLLGVLLYPPTISGKERERKRERGREREKEGGREGGREGERGTL